MLDRDGTINADSPDFIKSPAEWLPLPGSLDAIARLCRAGYTVVVASNQSGIARGLLDRRTLYRIHAKMRRAVRAAGGEIDRIVYCPHHPDDGCDCRKPLPGLINRLVEHYAVDAADVIVVGDSRRDLEAAVTAGARPVLVRTGNGTKTESTLDGPLAKTPVFDSLAALAAYIEAQ